MKLMKQVAISASLLTAAYLAYRPIAQAENVKRTLEFAQFASLPPSAEHMKMQVKGSLFGGSEYLSFHAPAEEIETFIGASPCLRDLQVFPIDGIKSIEIAENVFLSISPIEFPWLSMESVRPCRVFYRNRCGESLGSTKMVVDDAENSVHISLGR